ncbi:hypothetical protein NO1_1438 [Candidatus Termititenax aidoneus]|uniref:Alpha/beta hydrolase n=1 Tax=Termititenax aidoneus TaxID=2218524 RepID=A0A388TBP4_TERA1|nr:hypothetical protein NO1_1438 [Candidatus Termititenax aidoneus]
MVIDTAEMWRIDSQFNNWLKSNQRLLREDYEKQNIKISYPAQAKSKLCIIFCSSNGVYAPGTKEIYLKQIRELDRYDWQNIAKHSWLQRAAAKMIFIRDVYEQCYVTGINSRLHDLNLLIKYLKKETQGYRVITMGSSSGGYAAVLLGIKLRARRIITMSGLFSLWLIAPRHYLLDKYKTVKQVSKYYDLRPFLKKTKIPILYFYPAKCSLDIEQAELIKDYSNILPFRMNSAQHGPRVHGAEYPYLLLSSDRDIQKLYRRYQDKLIQPDLFWTDFRSLLRVYGLYPYRLLRKMLGKTRRMLVKEKTDA